MVPKTANVEVNFQGGSSSVDGGERRHRPEGADHDPAATFFGESGRSLFGRRFAKKQTRLFSTKHWTYSSTDGCGCGLDRHVLG